MRARLRAVVILLGVFAAGAVSGGAIMARTVSHQIQRVLEGNPKKVLPLLYGDVLARRLGLSDAQRSEVERIVDEDHAELARAGRTLYPELSVMRQKRHARIRALLTPAQQGPFDAMVADYERRRREEIDLEPSGAP
ncbi:MAG TPA: hypothetical protein VHV30_00565 [Polyangiaceae bacterium]|jgi:hypothetical protein|nr:hypothetical protein [Polyangiaceae bacterium]